MRQEPHWLWKAGNLWKAVLTHCSETHFCVDTRPAAESGVVFLTTVSWLAFLPLLCRKPPPLCLGQHQHYSVQNYPGASQPFLLQWCPGRWARGPVGGRAEDSGCGGTSEGGQLRDAFERSCHVHFAEQPWTLGMEWHPCSSLELLGCLGGFL